MAVSLLVVGLIKQVGVGVMVRVRVRDRVRVTIRIRVSVRVRQSLENRGTWRDWKLGSQVPTGLVIIRPYMLVTVWY